MMLRVEKSLLIALFIFLAFVFAQIVVKNWHTLFIQKNTTIFLEKAQITGCERSCFEIFVKSDENRATFLKVFANGKLVKREKVRLGNNFKKIYCIPLEKNENFVEIILDSKSLHYIAKRNCNKTEKLEFSFKSKKAKSVNVDIVEGFLLAMLFLAVFWGFRKRDSETFAAAFFYFLFINSSLGLVLAIFGVLERTYVLLAQSLAIVFLLIHSGKPKINIERVEVTLIEISIILFFSFLAFFYHLFTPSFMSPFNVYYEKITGYFLSEHKIPSNDELSYLGRKFIFAPAYFAFEASIGAAAGIKGEQLFAIMLVLAGVFFIFSSITLAKKFFREKQKYMPLILAMSTFVFSALTLTPRHCFSLSILMLAISRTIEKKRDAILILSFAILWQIPNIAFFLVLNSMLLFALGKKLKEAIAETIKVALPAFLAFLTIYLAIFPDAININEVEAKNWGYLIAPGLGFLFSDPGVLTVSFIVSFSVYLLKGLYRSRKLNRLLLLSITSSFIQCFISVRFNAVTSIAFALFSLGVIESIESKKSEGFVIGIAIALVIGLYLSTILAPLSLADKNLIDALNALASITNEESKVLTDPYYGHIVEYYTNRKVLADLMVEYADEEKLRDAYKFLENSNYEILKKYGIDALLLERFVIHKTALKIVEREEPTLKYLIKAACNDRFAVYKVGK